MQGNIIVNSTAIAQPMEKLLVNFNKMLSKKAYVHWYTNEGMDFQEFEEAASNLADLISEYRQYQEMGINNPEEEEEEEELPSKRAQIGSMNSSLRSKETRPSSGMDEAME
jgi:tubulin beta